MPSYHAEVYISMWLIFTAIHYFHISSHKLTHLYSHTLIQDYIQDSDIALWILANLHADLAITKFRHSVLPRFFTSTVEFLQLSGSRWILHFSCRTSGKNQTVSDLSTTPKTFTFNIYVAFLVQSRHLQHICVAILAMISKTFTPSEFINCKLTNKTVVYQLNQSQRK